MNDNNSGLSFLFKISKDGKCMRDDCSNRIKKDSKAYCQECKKKRSEFFKKKYYEKMGWTLNN